jgi:hypothetical protein
MLWECLSPESTLNSSFPEIRKSLAHRSTRLRLVPQDCGWRRVRCVQTSVLPGPGCHTYRNSVPPLSPIRGIRLPRYMRCNGIQIWAYSPPCASIHLSGLVHPATVDPAAEFGDVLPTRNPQQSSSMLVAAAALALGMSGACVPHGEFRQLALFE